MAIQYKLNEEKNIDVELDITFRKLYKLKDKYKSDYDRFMDIFRNGAKTPFDYLHILYVGYLCSNNEPAYSFDDFMELADFNTLKINRAANALMTAKKK